MKSDKEKAMLLSVTLAAFETVALQERPGSARRTRMERMESRVALLVDMYRRDTWPPHDMALANALVDEFNDAIATRLDTVSDVVTLHIGLAAFESVRASEENDRYRRLTRGLERILELAEPWDIEALPARMIIPACELGDLFERRVGEVFA